MGFNERNFLLCRHSLKTNIRFLERDVARLRGQWRIQRGSYPAMALPSVLGIEFPPWATEDNIVKEEI